jgi:hypothetical protein
MDEGNLLYVAVTRAKHALQISPTLKTILSLCGVSKIIIVFKVGK